MNLERTRRNVVEFALARASRRSGGSVLITGLGVRHPTGRASVSTQMLVRSADLLCWRDFDSRGHAGRGFVVPDWAFRSGISDEDLRSSGSNRNLLGITLRGDRPLPSDAWIDSVRTYADSHGLRIATFSQVVRDRARAEWLADRFGCECVPWASYEHAAHEANVRSFMGGCSVVVSDRLHALILALTEGACPLLVSQDGFDPKVARTFAGAGIESPVISVDDLACGRFGSAGDPALRVVRERVYSQLRDARGRLSSVSDLMQMALQEPI